MGLVWGAVGGDRVGFNLEMEMEMEMESWRVAWIAGPQDKTAAVALIASSWSRLQSAAALIAASLHRSLDSQVAYFPEFPPPPPQSRTRIASNTNSCLWTTADGTCQRTSFNFCRGPATRTTLLGTRQRRERTRTGLLFVRSSATREIAGGSGAVDSQVASGRP